MTSEHDQNLDFFESVADFERFVKEYEKGLDDDTEVVSNSPERERFHRAFADHGFFELYALMLQNNLQIDIQYMSSISLIDDIQRSGYQIDDNTIATYTLPEWTLETGRYGEYCIRLQQPLFRIFENDVFYGPDGKEYSLVNIGLTNNNSSIFFSGDLESIRNATEITIMNVHTQYETTMSGYDFMRVMNNFNIVYVNSKWLNYVHTNR